MYSVSHPDYAKIILKSNAPKDDDVGAAYTMLRPWIGKTDSFISRGINVKHFYSGVVQVQDPSGMDLLKLTCKQKENWTVEKVSRMFTVLSFNSNNNL